MRKYDLWIGVLTFLMFMLNLIDLYLTLAICEAYACVELNNWILSHPFLKLIIPLIYIIIVYSIEISGKAIRGVTLISLIIINVLLALAVVNNYLLVRGKESDILVGIVSRYFSFNLPYLLIKS